MSIPDPRPRARGLLATVVIGILALIAAAAVIVLHRQATISFTPRPDQAQRVGEQRHVRGRERSAGLTLPAAELAGGFEVAFGGAAKA